MISPAFQIRVTTRDNTSFLGATNDRANFAAIYLLQRSKDLPLQALQIKTGV